MRAAAGSARSWSARIAIRRTKLSVTETLLAQQVEFLFFSGVYNPDPLNDMCRAAGVRCVNIDLPGSRAPSVVSDNRGGARDLTRVVIDKLLARGADISDIFFFGGAAKDDATHNRLLGFKDALAEHGIKLGSARHRLLRLPAKQRGAVACEPLRSARASSVRTLRQRRDGAGGRAALHLHASGQRASIGRGRHLRLGSVRSASAVRRDDGAPGRRSR